MDNHSPAGWQSPVLRNLNQQLDDDVERANSLMALYEIRAKIREQDNTSLLKLREKIAALQARQQQAEKKEAEGRPSRFMYPKSAS